MSKYITLIACFGLFSCSTIGYVSMESLYPSELSFPLDVKSVGIVDNAVNHDTLLANGITIGKLEGDGKIMARQFAVNLADANYFEYVMLCDSSLRSGTRMDAPLKLSQEKVRQLTSDLNVDMLVTVDGISIKTWPDVELMGDPPYPVEVVEGEISTVISVYVPSRKEPMHLALGAQDTVFWELIGPLTEKYIVEDASSYGASLPLKYLVPQWKPEERLYYSGGCVELHDAAVYVKENNWEDAFLLWKKSYESSKSKSKKRMRSALNMALYYEMQSNIPEALKYAKEAMDLAKPGSPDKKYITFYYSAQLSDKSVKMQKLELQMKRFDKK